MKEWFQRLFSRKDAKMPTNHDTFTELDNPEKDFWLRYTRLKIEAERKKKDGGDAQLEQETKELIAGTMGYIRINMKVRKSDIPRVLGVAREDYELAEAGVLEDEKFSVLLDKWLDVLGYEKNDFLARAEQGARTIIQHKKANR
ncbi:MAG: hypothetical protein IPK17_30825 [Chloroflexi bacterium]|uniref:hypothetical protein n=1 Tax=Candidatus Flexifilum breve TaxID=3140694 RepID=UPI003135AF9F|nr:hypothetical protein [Chloroflexota bacterium]